MPPGLPAIFKTPVFASKVATGVFPDGLDGEILLSSHVKLISEAFTI